MTPRFSFDFAKQTATHKDFFVHYTSVEQQVRDSLLRIDDLRVEGNFNGLVVSHEEFFPIGTNAVRDSSQVLRSIADHYSDLAERIRDQIKQ